MFKDLRCELFMTLVSSSSQIVGTVIGYEN